MASGSNVDMLPTLGNGLPGSGENLEDALQNELELILQAKRSRQIGGQRDMDRYRSGSAPPTVDGSLNAIGGLLGTSAFGDIRGMGVLSGNNGMLSEEEIRSHPAYLAYYYSHENINPRLPPPLLSKEDWRVAQRFQGSGSLLGGMEDWRREKLADGGENSSLFSMQPSFPVEQADDDLTALRDAGGRNIPERLSSDWLGRNSDGIIGLSGPVLGSRRRSFADILQDGSDCSTSLSGQLSRSPSCNAFSNPLDNPSGFCNELEYAKSLQSGQVGIQRSGTGSSHSFASSIGSSMLRSKTAEQQLLGRSAASGLPPVGSKVCPTEKKNVLGSSIQNGHSSAMNELAEIAAALSSLNLAKTGSVDENFHVSRQKIDPDNQPTFSLSNSYTQSLQQQQQLIDQSNAENLTSSINYQSFVAKNGILPNLNASNLRSNGQVRIPKRTSSSANLYSKVHSSALADSEGSNAFYPNEKFPSRNAAYAEQILDSVAKSQLFASDVESLNSLSKKGSEMHSSVMDARYIQYLQRVPQSGLQNRPSPDAFFSKDHSGTSFKDIDQLQKAYIAALAVQHKQQFELPLLAKTGALHQGIYGNTSYGTRMPYLGNQMPNSLFPFSCIGNVQNERISCFNSIMRSSVGTCYPDADNHLTGRFISSLLDEFKNNKTRSFELSDIVDHVVEFSMDQYGSRFIQQKLETAMEEDKVAIFPEIIPHARTLMTDVFGNYVIQKFFEHGTESQRAELASQLTGHVLPLSLQMYGCRVIQKALEVVDLDQQTRMVKELDGSVMKCVRDQNGNHVIQKSIECVPQDRIQFIISAFYGQVVALSTHPYGCRVIQRVLEHCNDQETQQIVMDEIMQSVCSLAQDQYGNYVIQHVLEHGKPSERSAIISKLAGQIVKMSQQKFASNVVEKCLTFGGPQERKLLVDEMLGLTDENEPLQAMMKDPFGNYVVQKVLETCDDQSLQLILSRIKIHLNTLKKYTYGKHIVSRVEKLIATGERRIMLSSYTS